MTEFVVEERHNLHPVARELRDVAVLVEPLTIAEKALIEVREIQRRLPWGGGPHRAVVLGSGPVGLLGAMALVNAGFETYVYSRDRPSRMPKPRLPKPSARDIFHRSQTPIAQMAEQVGNIDLIYEAAGAPQFAFEVLKHLGSNGIYVFTGVPRDQPPIEFDTERIMCNLVLKNQVVVGVVNAGPQAFDNAVRDIGVFAARWPQAVARHDHRALSHGGFPRSGDGQGGRHQKRDRDCAGGQVIAELARLAEDERREKNWKRWGPYLSERQWGTVREDYSADGTCWEYFPHDHARSRAYRWGEDGLLGICDRECRLCFALALWNGRDPILKERLFGLTNHEGNHGEDVKECYYYLDSTPTHSYMKALYKYPQADFPYARLVEENRRRGREQPEFELEDTGIFDDQRYFDVFVEYAKAAPDDLAIRISAVNRGPERAPLALAAHAVVPQHMVVGTHGRGVLAEAQDQPRRRQHHAGGARFARQIPAGYGRCERTPLHRKRDQLRNGCSASRAPALTSKTSSTPM